MSETGPRAALRGAAQDALAALRFGWGEAYWIGYLGHQVARGCSASAADA